MAHLNSARKPPVGAMAERPSQEMAQRWTGRIESHHPDSRIVVRTTRADETATLERIWARSQDEDEPKGRPQGGWWSITRWATASSLLLESNQAVGFAAIEYRAGADAAEARVALLPEHRTPMMAARLIRTILTLASDTGAPRVRLYMPEAAQWARDAASAWEFKDMRTQHIMLRPADAAPFLGSPVEGVHIRALRDGEEPALLAALNRAWATTWNARPLSATALAHDLEGQRAGMLVAVDTADETRIVATVHALVNPDLQNPDGQRYAWISNLTADPAWRGRGLGRAMLVAGLDYLRSHGARSVALGVDGGNIVPLALYRTAGFVPLSTIIIAERPVIGLEELYRRRYSGEQR